jgi:oligoendopeptidase F
VTADVKLGVTLPQFTGDAGRFLDGARRAEALGLDSVWLFDHLWPPWGGPDDPVLEQDLDAADAAAAAFAQRYRGRVSALDAAGLAQACAELEATGTPIERVGAFAHLRFAADTRDETCGALMAKVHERQAGVSSGTLFFELEWNALSDERADELLADPARRAALGRAGAERVRARYGWERVADSVLALYDEVIGRGSIAIGNAAR